MKGAAALIVAFLATSALAGELICPKEQAENWEIEALLRHPDCEKFYKCTFGVPVEQNCPAGLHFNLEIWACDWIDNVDCSDRNDPTAPVTDSPEEELAPEEEVVPEEETAEEIPEEEEAVPEEEESVTEEEEVVPEEAKPETEEEEVVPEEELPETEEEEVVPEEEQPETEEEEAEKEEVVPEESPEEEETPEEIPEEEIIPEESAEEVKPNPGFLPNGCPVDPHVHWLLPHETNPNEFYYCVWGDKVLRNCPAVLVFNPVIQVCDWPQNVADQDGGTEISRTSMNKHLEARRKFSDML